SREIDDQLMAIAGSDKRRYRICDLLRLNLPGGVGDCRHLEAFGLQPVSKGVCPRRGTLQWLQSATGFIEPDDDGASPSCHFPLRRKVSIDLKPSLAVMPVPGLDPGIVAGIHVFLAGRSARKT